MFRLAIIDDEESTRRGLRQMLDWRVLDIEIVGEAADGQEGVTLINREQPDIIICDVRMPRLDGIALVSQVRPAFPRLQIIFLSGHVEKEYLRSAIRFGALDYLDKPVEKSELLRVVQAAIARCRETHHDRRPESYAQLAIGLITGQHSATGAELIGCPIDFSGAYITLAFSFNLPAMQAAGNHVDAEEPLHFLQQHHAAYQSALSALCPGGALLYIYQHHYVGHVQLPNGKDAPAFEKLIGCVPCHQPYLSIGVSEPAQGAGQASTSYKQALHAERSFFDGFGHIFIPRPDKPAQHYRSGDAELSGVIALVRAQQFAQATVRLSGCLDGLRQCDQRDIPLIRGDLAQLALELGELIRPDDRPYQFAIVEHVKRTCRSMPDIYRYLQDLLGSLISSQESLSSKGRVIYDVERYIIDHYHEDLSIQAIADTVFLTPTYLCYLYKKATGKTINTFITEVKIEKAKQLLKDSTLRLSDIADSLGYASQNYLTRIFTKTVGMTPSKYRNSVL